MMEGLKSKALKIKRGYIQLLVAVLYNCHFTGFADGRIYNGRSKGVCVPGLNCYSCPGAVGACPLGSLQGELAGSGFRFPLYVLGTLMLFGILLGRVICGFLCPFGFLQELIYKIPTKKIKKSRVTRALSYIKYGVLAVCAVIIPIVLKVPGFCKYICPAGTLEAGIPLVTEDEHLRGMTGTLFSWKVLVLCICVLGCIFCYRAFCRFICPLGAFYSFFNPVTFFGISVDADKCTGCNACIGRCPVDVRKVGDHECVHCGACKEVCPEGAIDYRLKIKE